MSSDARVKRRGDAKVEKRVLVIRSKLNDSPTFFDLFVISSLGGIETNSPFTFQPREEMISCSSFELASK